MPTHTEILQAYLDSLPRDAAPSQAHVARKFVAWLGARGLTRRTVEEWISAEEEQGYAPNTIRQELGVIRRLFLTNTVVWPLKRGEGVIVGERDVDAKRFSIPDVSRLITASFDPVLSDVHRAYLAMSTTYGLRRVEVATLGAGSFEFSDRPGASRVYVETAKHGRQKYHLIPDVLLPVLQAHSWQVRSTSYVTKRFLDILAVAGLKGDPRVADAGWHAIRRSLDRALMGSPLLQEWEVIAFLRWKRSSTLMSRTYAMTREIDLGNAGAPAGADVEDAAIDNKAFSVNPWLPVWAECIAQQRAAA